MAGLVNIGNNIYLGNLVLGGSTEIKNGTFVVPDFTNGTAVPPADDIAADGEVYFVVNEIDTVQGEMIDDLDFTVKPGKYLKMKKLLPGEVITTTEFKETLNVGDVVAVGDGGTLEAIGVRTPKQSYTVIEKPTLWGVTCVKCIVNE